MKKINHIIIHCSATPEGREHTLADLDRWHKKRGFTTVNGITVGYHFVIRLDGTTERGRPLNRIGAHTVGRNSDSIGICYIGGTDNRLQPKDTRTDPQKKAMEGLIKEMLLKYPDAVVSGHNQWANKACPCFDVPAWWESVK